MLFVYSFCLTVYVTWPFLFLTEQTSNLNQIYWQLYLIAELKGKTGLIPCSHHWCLNMVVLAQIQNPLMKNLRLHRKNLRAEGPPKNQSGSNFASTKFAYGWLCTNFDSFSILHISLFYSVSLASNWIQARLPFLVYLIIYQKLEKKKMFPK